MQKNILIAGGAGFIGSHLADELSGHGYAVRVHPMSGIARQAERAVDCRDIEPEITGTRRLGGVRNRIPYISLAGDVLGFPPEIGLSEGLCGLADRLEGQTAWDHAKRVGGLRGRPYAPASSFPRHSPDARARFRSPARRASTCSTAPAASACLPWSSA